MDFRLWQSFEIDLEFEIASARRLYADDVRSRGARQALHREVATSVFDQRT
ncbi:hypothetical protein ACVWZW_005579, partial [Bradyrhizobium sp. F1.13.4]